MASPLDSQYANNVARLIFQNQQQRRQLSEQDTQDKADFDTQIKRMAEDRAKTLRNVKHQANREGLFYSAQLGKRNADTNHTFDEQRGDTQQAYDRRVAARAAALSQLGQITANGASPLGYSGTGQSAFDLQDNYNDAVSRQIDRDQSLAVPGPATPGAPGAPAGGARPPAPGPTGATKVAPSAAHGGQNWVYVQNSNGTWRPVRPVNGFGH